MTIIKWMDQVLVHKKSWDSFSDADKKSFSPYIINRWLSMDKDFIETVNYFQKYAIGILEPREIYKFYCEVLPKGKRFNKYIKNRLNKKYNSELVGQLCSYFECSKSQTREILEMISKEELKYILNLYGIDSNKIRKLIK